MSQGNLSRKNVGCMQMLLYETLKSLNGLMSSNIMWIICSNLGRCQISERKHVKEAAASIIIKTQNDWMSSQTMMFIPWGESRDNTLKAVFFLYKFSRVSAAYSLFFRTAPLMLSYPLLPPSPWGLLCLLSRCSPAKGMVMLFHSQLWDYIQLQYILRNNCNSSRYMGASVSCIIYICIYISRGKQSVTHACT